MRKHYPFLVLSAILLFVSFPGRSQGSADYGSGLKIGINEDKSKYIRFIFWNQIWARYIENNPGTLVNGVSEDKTFDIGGRRLRFLAIAQISPRYMILTHVGINNQTFLNGGGSGTSGTGGYGQGKKPQLFFHDAWNEYAIIPEINPETKAKNNYSLSLGAGLHYMHGLSRMTSASTLNFLMIDAPIFNWPLIENTDQFGRQYGLFVKGYAGKLRYQMHVNKPFATTLAADTARFVAAFNETREVAVENNGNSKAGFGGYFEYNFLEKESALLPFRTGTYIGTKRILNLGAGFYSQADATQSKDAAGKLKKHAINLFAADVFADLPFGDKEKNMAVTAYSVLYAYDFGPNYIRNIGIMNEGLPNTDLPSSARVFEGGGNARAMMGTGTIWYTQAGLLLPKTISKKMRIQPIASLALKKFEALKESGSYFDIGANFFLDGHHSKFTLQYSSRPTYEIATRMRSSERKGELMLQFQIFL
ncbi:MAG: porin [Bacteroidetes bacterium]|nr:porin [Bacteroidota bacterium]